MSFVLGIVVALVAFRFWQDRMGFRAQRPGDYARGYPIFDLRRDLSGRFVCEGVIFGPLGRVSSRFAADVEATWVDGTVFMTEHFRYDSGDTQRRQWRLTLFEDGRIAAEADDVVGSGEGRAEGSAVQLRYRIRLPEKTGGHVLDTIDWLYLLENGTIVNRSQFHKFGFKVAELVATFRRLES